MQKIIDYIVKKYNPLSVILYGSYADGSNNENSDFDALVIVKDGEAIHDTAIVENIQMDVWVYPVSKFRSDFDADEIVQIFDGVIVLDTDNIGRDIKNKVEQHIAELPLKSTEEAKDELEWCRKMLLRAERRDAEGMYRLHWLVTDSLQIACDVLGHHYFGPKKTLKWLKDKHPDLYNIYALLLKDFNLEAMTLFINKLYRYISPDIPMLDRETIRQELRCKIYPLGYLERYKYTVICSSFNGKWILSKHKKRNTWETQGGHIEDGETPLECARRELFEESGIKDAELYPVCDYWGFNTQACSNGMVFLAVVHSLGELPESEMKEIKIFDTLPAELTYPQTSPKLYAEAAKMLKKVTTKFDTMKIETTRLIIRNFMPDDLGDLYEILGDSETMKNCEPAYDLPKTKEFLHSFCIGRNGAVAAVHKQSQKVIGYILFNETQPSIYEMGWIFNRSYWRQSYAYEACKAVIDYAFRECDAHKVFAEAIDGVKSVGLMQKLGMKLEGVQRSQTKDNDGNPAYLYFYGLLREEIQ